VIVPAYHAADLIGEAIESVLAQTLPAHEILVYDDDGGGGDLRRALEPYGDAIELLRGAHVGVGGARNAAVARATGEFVVMLDADDRCLPDRLKALGELAAARPDLDVLATDAFVEVAGTPIGRFNRQTPFEVDDQRNAILERCFFAWPAIRRRRLLAIGGFDESLRRGDDWECAIRLVLSGCVAGLVDEALYRYRLRPGSLTAARREALHDRVKLLEATLEHPGLSPPERRTLCGSIASARRKLLRAEAEVSLREGRGDARTRSMRLACAEGAPTRARMQALAWSLAPRWAARRIEADAQRHGRRSLASTAPWQA
jgi:cellulose synthase/poly-beta-1,6-N-acetylglucosamine synthase-like glycosyltransferase